MKTRYSFRHTRSGRRVVSRFTERPVVLMGFPRADLMVVMAVSSVAN
jgi:hypothetical protein